MPPSDLQLAHIPSFKNMVQKFWAQDIALCSLKTSTFNALSKSCKAFFSFVTDSAPPYTSHVSLRYVPDLVNMLQGFFVFLVFVCKRNVWNAITGKRVNFDDSHEGEEQDMSMQSLTPRISQIKQMLKRTGLILLVLHLSVPLCNCQSYYVNIRP